ncbi:MAG: PAS domain S-box protein [Bacteroidota bacterium]
MGLFIKDLSSSFVSERKQQIVQRIILSSLIFSILIILAALMFQMSWLLIMGILSVLNSVALIFLAQRQSYDYFSLMVGLGFFPLIAISPTVLGPLYLIPLGVLSIVVVTSHLADRIQTLKWISAMAIVALCIYWVQLCTLALTHHLILYVVDALIGIVSGFIIYITLATYQRYFQYFEGELAHSIDFLQQILDANPHVLFAKDMDLRYRYLNHVAANWLQAKPEDFLGFHRDEIEIFKNRPNPLREVEERVLQEGQPQYIPRQKILDRQGNPRWIDFSQTPLWDNQGKVSGLFTVATDRTDEVIKEKELARSEALYRGIFENSPIGLGMYRDGVVSNPNQALLDIAGFSKHKSVQIPMAQKVDQEVFEQIQTASWDSMVHEIRTEKEYVNFYREGGEIRHVQIRIIPISSEAKAESLITITDVTDLVQQKQDLARLVSELEAIFESTGEGMCVSDPEGNLLKYNQQFLDNLIFDRFDEKLSLTDRIERHIEYRVYDPEGFKQRIKDIHASKDKPSYDVIEYKDGMVLERSSYPQKIGNQIVGRVFTFKDITQQRHNEKALLESEMKYRTLFEQTPMGLFLLDLTAEQIGLQCNSRMEALFKAKKTQLQKSHMLDWSPEFQLDGESSKIKYDKLTSHILKKREVTTFEWQHIDSEGGLFDCETTLVPLQLGQKFWTLGIIQDVTERKHQEHIIRQQLADLNRQNQQLTGYSYVISHNFRSSVANIMGLTDAFEIDERATDVNQRIVKMLQEMAGRLDESVKDLQQILDVQGVTESYFEPIDIQQTLEKIQTELSTKIKAAGAQIFVDLPKPLLLYGLSAYFQSVFFNLLSNAIKYQHPERKPQIRISHQLRGDRIRICVRDNGLGIDLEKFKGQIFSLYKRFHDHVEGKGLGLFLVKAQVEAMGGKITLESDLEKGSTFILDFPHPHMSNEHLPKPEIQKVVE